MSSSVIGSTWNKSSAFSANIDRELSEKLTRVANSPLASAFFDKKNLNTIQAGIIKSVNQALKDYLGPQSKCGIDRQSDREVMLLMIEFFEYHRQMLSTSGFVNREAKSDLYRQIPVPAQFLFSDPGDTYIPQFFPEKKGIGNTNPTDNWGQIQRYNTETVPLRCIGNRKYYTDLPFYDESLPMHKRVGYLNKKFIDFITPKILYEIKNYFKFRYQQYDTDSCFVDNPEYVASRSDKGLSLQKYYNGKSEQYTPFNRKGIIKNGADFPLFEIYEKPTYAINSQEKFVPLSNPLGEQSPRSYHLTNQEQYTCSVAPRSLEKTLINPEVYRGETDVLFRREQWAPSNLKRRMQSYHLRTR
jgi:hypothetical protein